MHEKLHQFFHNDVWERVRDLKESMELALNGSSKTSLMSVEQLLEINQDLLNKDALKWKELTLMRYLHL